MPEAANIVSTDVQFTGDGVRVAWSDGRACTFPYRYLRLQCACAACVEEMTGRRILSVASVPDDVIAVEHIPVGRYALQFLWSDGHETGIYPFKMLLNLAEKDAAVIFE
jgi:DUF971 family protein